MQQRRLSLSLFVGLGCLANAVLETVLALSLSTGAFLLVSTVIRGAAIAGLVVGLVGWLLWTGRA